MRRARFTGDGETCTVFGHTFTWGEFLIDHTLTEDELDRLDANPTFEVEDPDVEA